jgi:hypothetical protein
MAFCRVGKYKVSSQVGINYSTKLFDLITLFDDKNVFLMSVTGGYQFLWLLIGGTNHGLGCCYCTLHMLWVCYGCAMYSNDQWSEAGVSWLPKLWV